MHEGRIDVQVLDDGALHFAGRRGERLDHHMAVGVLILEQERAGRDVSAETSENQS